MILPAALGLALFAVGDTATAELYYRSERFLTQRWATEAGLPQSKVQCVLPTADGYIWAGGSEALARFDGVRFVPLAKDIVPGIKDAAVAALAEDKVDGGLWIASTEGLLYYNSTNHQFRRYTTADDLPHQKVWHLLSMSSGELWLETEVGLARFYRGQFKVLTKDDGLPDTRVFWMQESSAGVLYLGKRDWWRRWDAKAERFVSFDFPGLSTNLWTSTVRFSTNGDWLIGTDHGLYRGNEGRWEHFDEAAGLSDPRIQVIHEDPLNGLWVATRDSNLYHLVAGRFESVPLGTAPHNDGITDLCVDREGNLWAATVEGLFQIKRRNVQVYSTQNGLVNDGVHSVCEGPDGTIWVGTGRGVSAIHDDKVVSFAENGLFKEKNNQKSVSSIAADGANHVWLSMHFLVELTRRNKTNFTVGETYGLGAAQALYSNQQGQLWGGIAERGVFHWADYSAIKETKPLEGSARGADVFLEDRQHRLWFANTSGLYRWNGEKLETFTAREGVATARIHALCEDADGTLWIGTEKELIRLRESGELFRFDTKHGLLESRVNSILDDGLGFLWLGGSRGIYRVSRAELNEVAEGKHANAKCVRFNESDGLLSVETADDFNPACKSRDGRLWFATRKGLAVIDPKSVRANFEPPLVVIEQVKADGEVVFGDGAANCLGSARASPTESAGSRKAASESFDYSASSNNLSVANGALPTTREARVLPKPTLPSIRFGPGHARVLEIRFTANSFVASEKIRFKYKLEGRDKEWIEVDSKERRVFCPDLRPGHYTFRVKACNNHGVWNEAGAKFAFSIAPKFTQTIWFPLSCAAGLLAASGGFTVWRLRWQRRAFAAERAAAIEQERARIARDLHDDLGAQLTGLALRAGLLKERSSDAEGKSLEEIAQTARGLAGVMGEVVWALNPACDTWRSFARFVAEQTEAWSAQTGIACTTELPESAEDFAMRAEARHHLALVLREALNNVARHASATHATVRLDNDDKGVTLTVRDGGQGFDASKLSKNAGNSNGNGLRNMRQRVEALGGTFGLETAPGGGTCVKVFVPRARLEPPPPLPENR